AGIEYVHLGKELGARSDDDACYRDDKVQYELLAQTPAFASGIARVMEGSRKFRIALMCAEHEPLECHRTILVARHLARAGARIVHILRGGSIESHEATLERLIQSLRPKEPHLFEMTASAAAERAYERQGQRIAYQRPHKTE